MRIVYDALVAVLFVVATGCGDEFQEDDNPCNGRPCNENPWCCGSGQTCALNTPTSFACMDVGAGQPGDSCQSFVGDPQCGELLFCLQLVGEPTGVCTWYCDSTNADRACPNYHHCFMGVSTDAAGDINVCDPNPPPG